MVWCRLSSDVYSLARLSSLAFFSLFSTLRTKSQNAMPLVASFMALAYFTLGMPSTLTTFMHGMGLCAGSSSRHRDVTREV